MEGSSRFKAVVMVVEEGWTTRREVIMVVKAWVSVSEKVAQRARMGWAGRIIVPNAEEKENVFYVGFVLHSSRTRNVN